LMLKGDALNGMGRSKEAVKAFMEAHKSSSLFLEPIKKLAEIYRDRDQDSYLKYLLKLDSLSPLNSERKCEIGKVYVKKSEMSEAEAYFDQAISCATKEALGYVSNVVETIADVLAEVSLEMSQKYLSQVLELKKDNLGPMDLSVFNRLGINLRQQGKWREAVENYKKALTIAPDDPGLFYNLAMAYLDGKGLKKASASLDKALSINPEFWKTSDSVCYNIAYIYYSVKDFSSARHHLKNTLELNPGNQKAKKLLDRIKGR
ncbi:MAG: tetratricopeptide repeat protein, partial [Desulfovibrionaceae bacterium]|nr:tetratricopeptide repeat protein [Desulfovibrionaceae bacterium]